MFLQIWHTSDEYFEKGKTLFSEPYRNWLLDKPLMQESLIARYLIAKEIWDGFMPQVGTKGVPIFTDENYWSLSHKKGVVFIGVSKEKIWVDIEICKTRDISLLDTFETSDYSMLWEKKWENFYILWTSHESIVKYTLEQKYEPWMYTLKSFQNKNRSISWLEFCYELRFVQWEKKYTLVTWKMWNYIYSVCL